MQVVLGDSITPLVVILVLLSGILYNGRPQSHGHPDFPVFKILNLQVLMDVF